MAWSKNRILFVVAVTSLISFGAIAAAPKWFNTPPSDTAEELFAVGVGASEQQARASALNNLASKIMVKVSSEFNQFTQASNSLYYEKAEEAIALSVDEATIHNYQVSKIKESRDRVYLLVSLDKRRLVDGLTRDLELLNEEVDRLLHQSSTTSPLLWHIQFAPDARGVLDKVRHKRHVLGVVSGIRYDDPASIQQLSLTIDKLPKDFCIQVDASQRWLAQILSQTIMRQGYKASTSHKCRYRYQARIDSNANYIFSRHNVKLNVDLKLFDTNSLIASNALLSSGSSVSSKSNAEKGAKSNLNKQLSVLSLPVLLGLEPIPMS